jgi:four helix bundle protein
VHHLNDLSVYRRALGFSRTVRTVTNVFPKSELFVLTSQFRRAADSIVLNIAEGAGNDSPAEFARFLGYSMRSGYECLACIDLAAENGFVEKDTASLLKTETNEIVAMLYGLRRHVLKKN